MKKHWLGVVVAVGVVIGLVLASCAFFLGWIRFKKEAIDTVPDYRAVGYFSGGNREKMNTVIVIVPY